MAKKPQNLPVIYKPASELLPDNDQWTNRFKVKSASSNRMYTIAQNKKKRHFACDCPGWKRHRKCKHLEHLALPNYEQAHEIELKQTNG